jgi:hypothetical protein
VKKIIFLFLILFLFIGCENSLFDSINPKIVAKVDNYKIKIGDVKRRIIRDNEKEIKITKPILLYYLKEIIREKIIEDEFKRAHLKITEKDKKEVPFLSKLDPDELRRWLIFKKVKAYVVRKLTPPSERECKEYYKEHIKEFDDKEKVKLKYIIFEKKDNAERLYNLAKKLSFEEALKKENLEPSYRGILNIDNIPDDIKSKINFEKENSLWFVQAENKYYYVVKVEKFFKGHLPFKMVKDKISEEILEQRRGELFDLWLKEEMKKRKIKIYYNKLD